MMAESGRHGCVVLGAGNVACALAPALEQAGLDVRQVYSRSLANAADLAARLSGAQAVDSLDAVCRDAELYLVALSDNAIAEVARTMAHTGGVWCHTSGGVAMDALAPATDSYGVFYPLQTFSKGRPVDMAAVPFFIEGSTADTQQMLMDTARKISSEVYAADSRMRLRLHAAAVFACNFVNFMWTNADDILRSGGLSLSVLHPLIKETLAKAMTMPPRDAQTGPARRGDTVVMQRHKQVMTPEQSRIYEFLTHAIIAEYNPDAG